MVRRRKVWSLTVGERGYRVTLCQRYPNRLSLRWWDGAQGNYRWKSLRHNDRSLGERQAREVAAHLLALGTAPARHALPVAELFARYEREVSVYKKGAGLREDRRRMDLWRAFLGSDRDVKTLDFATLDVLVSTRVPLNRTNPGQRRWAPGSVHIQELLNVPGRRST